MGPRAQRTLTVGGGGIPSFTLHAQGTFCNLHRGTGSPGGQGHSSSCPADCHSPPTSLAPDTHTHTPQPPGSLQAQATAHSPSQGRRQGPPVAGTCFPHAQEAPWVGQLGVSWGAVVTPVQSQVTYSKARPRWTSDQDHGDRVTISLLPDPFAIST